MCDKHNGNGVTVVKSLAGPTWSRGTVGTVSVFQTLWRPGRDVA